MQSSLIVGWYMGYVAWVLNSYDDYDGYGGYVELKRSLQFVARRTVSYNHVIEYRPHYEAL